MLNQPTNHQVKEELQLRAKEANRWPRSKRIGFPQTQPHPLAIEAYKLFLESNQNHIGTHTRQKRPFNGSHALEYEFIKEMAKLYEDETADGYINSGCTEGNIMALWIAREMFAKEPYYLIKTTLTHTSIDKAIRLLGITGVENANLDANYCLSSVGLKKAFDKLRKRKIKSFILCLTQGYTLTGSADKIEEICQLVKEYRQKYDLNFYVHVDAAIGGLPYKFCTNSKFDFANKEINSLVVDFHKMGRLPYSAGIFLCRKGLQDYIDQFVGYTGSHHDDTLIGSRGGAVAAACWAVWRRMGKKGYLKMFNQCLAKKAYFLRQLKKLFPKVEVLNFSEINEFALFIPDLPGNRLPSDIESDFRIVGSLLPATVSQKEKYVYKIFTMPHLRYAVIDEFIRRIKACL